MVIGVCRVELHIPENHSLKGKRRVVKSIKDRIRNKFNLSIAEVDNNDLWQRVTLGIAMIGNEKRFVNQTLEKVVNHIKGITSADVIDYQIELL